MRSYNQYCSMARALDLIGDRWTLLIVRELLTQGPCRFTDLRRGLPGIASNLLADHLREMESAALITRQEHPPPVATTLIRLTDRGEDLGGVIAELTRWGAPLMTTPPGDAEFRMHWISLPVRYLCRDGSPGAPASTVRFGSLDDGCDVVAQSGRIEIGRCSSERRPAAVVDAPPNVLIAVLTGQLSVKQAAAHGLTIDGSTEAFQRILPEGERSSTSDETC